jgi:DNA polymerase elongation subunit (family B)
MTKLLVTNTEQIQPEDRNDTIIVLYGRNPGRPDRRYRVNVHNFDPYFYADEGAVRESEAFLLGQECIQEIEYVGAEPFLGEGSLAKIYPNYPQDTREARELVPEAYAADVPFTNRFRIDSGVRDVIEVPDPPEGESTIECHWREVTPVIPESEA